MVTMNNRRTFSYYLGVLIIATPTEEGIWIVMFKTMQLGWSADAIDLNIQVQNGCIVGSIRLEAIGNDDYQTSAKEISD